MKIQYQMKQLLAETPGLNLIAFGDLSSGLILNWTAKAPCPREVLDLLGDEAVAGFAMLQPISPPPGTYSTLFGGSVIHFTERESRIFARPAANSDDVICMVGEPGAQLEALLRSAVALADHFAAPE